MKTCQTIGTRFTDPDPGASIGSGFTKRSDQKPYFKMVGFGSTWNIKIKNLSEIELFLQYLMIKVINSTVLIGYDIVRSNQGCFSISGSVFNSDLDPGFSQKSDPG